MMATRLAEGVDELDALRQRHGQAVWWAYLKGEYTGDLTRYPVPLLKVALPWFDQGTPWDYDPMPVLRRVDAPMH
jgi:hypothetical protein